MVFARKNGGIFYGVHVSLLKGKWFQIFFIIIQKPAKMIQFFPSIFQGGPPYDRYKWG